jgi:hypothetical protein
MTAVPSLRDLKALLPLFLLRALAGPMGPAQATGLPHLNFELATLESA